MARPFWFTKILVRSGLARFLPIARRLTDGGTAFLRYYSDTVLAAPVEELLDAAFFPTAGPDVIDLNLAAPRFESNASIGRMTADRRGNPPACGLMELRRAIAAYSVSRGGPPLDPEREVLATHGASGAFAAVLDAFVNPGDRVVLFDPSSPLFSLGVKSRRARVRWVATHAEDGRCRYSHRELESALRGAKLLVLANPANPTGSCLDAESFAHLAKMAAKRGVLVYLDESFGLGSCAAGAAPAPPELHRPEQWLRAGSMAPGWGLGSLRVGWLTGHRHLIQACAVSAGLHAPYVPTLDQQIAARALGESAAAGDGPAPNGAGPALDKRQYVVHRLRGLGLEVEWPAAGFFAWVSVANLGWDGRTFAENLLREQRVLVRPGCVFGPSGTHRIRISFAADDGRLREGLARLAAFVNGARGTASAAPAPAIAEPAAAPLEPAFSRM